jgi:7-cyano-7-deazaguanine reductase
MMDFICDLPLGRPAFASTSYDPDQLRPIPRKIGREDIGISTDNHLPFLGEDVWNCWELSWLDSNGKPVIAVAEIRIPATTPNMVESKSLKLYLNSFSMTRINSPETLRQTLARDISRIVERNRFCQNDTAGGLWTTSDHGAGRNLYRSPGHYDNGIHY